MFTRPEDIDDGDLATVLRAGWGIDLDRLDHAPVGFGSHHWIARTVEGVRWFVTVDDLEAKRRDDGETVADAGHRLTAALETARALRDVGLAFVVAPRRTSSGSVIQPLGARYAVAVYPFVEGRSETYGPYRTRAERVAIVERLVELHAATDAVAGIARSDDHAVPRRRELEAAVEAPEDSWETGPFGPPAGALLRRHARPLAGVLRRYDRLVAEVAAGPDRAVVTHGEPHRGNTITTEAGVQLIDWDTALLAPPERDLWTVIGEDPAMATEYTRRSGRAVDEPTVELYRLWWDLCEIALFVDQFRRAHGDTDDDRTAWAGLAHHLDPARWTAG